MENFELEMGETVLKEVKGDCWEVPLSIKSQTPGKYIFTDKRIVFLGGGLIKSLRLNFDLRYADIATMKGYNISMMIPTGIRITLKNGDVYKLSILARKQIMELIAQQMGGAPLTVE